MKLLRNKMNDAERRGTWYFTIEGKESDAVKIETAENKLREMSTDISIGGVEQTWNDFCDGCPCYTDGFGSGFWIPVDMVEDFKSAWKIAKK